MMYNKIVHDYFFLPQHVGALDCSEPRTVCYSTKNFNPVLIIDLYMRCEETYIVSSICYKTNGNPYVIASLEWLCRQSLGKKYAELCFNQEALTKLLEIPFNQIPVVLSVKEVFQEVLNLMKVNDECSNTTDR